MSLQLWNNCQKAASYFDENKPRWWESVDLSDFDMYDTCKCMLGQTNLDLPDFLHRNIRNEDIFAIDYPNYPNHCKKLEKYWTTLINQRKDNED